MGGRVYRDLEEKASRIWILIGKKRDSADGMPHSSILKIGRL